MRRLILMRHAKSSWDDPAQADIDRPLNARGVRDAGKIGRWLAAIDVLPDQGLVSVAERTRESWAGVTAVIGTRPVDFRSELYQADAATLRAVLREASGAVVLMLAHQPGIGDFAHRLVASMPSDAGFADYPTAATAVIDFAIDDWADLGWKSGLLRNFTVPRALG